MATWRVARSLETLLAQFNARYPSRSKASDGGIGDAAHASRASDHNPWFGPATDGLMLVTARDFTHDPAAGMDIDRLTDELAASRDPRIKYIIANGYIMDSRPGTNPWRWVKYTGSNPHRKHFHLSVLDDVALADDRSPWNLPSFNAATVPLVQEGDDLTPEQDAILRRIENELLGPRGDRGQIAGWGTVNGPRTVVAMLVDVVNKVYGGQPPQVDAAAVVEGLKPAIHDAVLDVLGGQAYADVAQRVAAEFGRRLAGGSK
ncbi:hypothetical protein [Saccharopolyspora hattusasensis]|uniref:hypothetical protein n=1 Tax=Saccharopolyspora hattusasensis TaxID=1128679 RepID=UPI003D96238C